MRPGASGPVVERSSGAMTRRGFLQLASVAGLAGPFGGRRGVAAAAPVANTVLGIAADGFTINGTRTFLLGVSYFDARHWKESDIDALAVRRFNNIRIWLENAGGKFWKRWHLEPEGTLNDPAGLLGLIRYCAAKGITVEVTILDWESSPLSKNPALAIDNVVSLLKDEPNVFYDLCNEHTYGAGVYASHALVRQYRDRVKSIQAQQPVTASGCCGHLIGPSDEAIRADLADDVHTARLDFVAPHMPRTADWSSKTGIRVKSVKSGLASLNRDVPVFLQEEARRRHSGLDPTATQFVDAARRARDAGAAGWIFHTDAGFDLSGKRSFMLNLDPEERNAVEGLASQVG